MILVLLVLDNVFYNVKFSCKKFINSYVCWKGCWDGLILGQEFIYYKEWNLKSAITIPSVYFKYWCVRCKFKHDHLTSVKVNLNLRTLSCKRKTLKVIRKVLKRKLVSVNNTDLKLRRIMWLISSSRKNKLCRGMSNFILKAIQIIRFMINYNQFIISYKNDPIKVEQSNYLISRLLILLDINIDSLLFNIQSDNPIRTIVSFNRRTFQMKKYHNVNVILKHMKKIGSTKINLLRFCYLNTLFRLKNVVQNINSVNNCLNCSSGFLEILIRNQLRSIYLLNHHLLSLKTLVEWRNLLMLNCFLTCYLLSFYKIINNINLINRVNFSIFIMNHFKNWLTLNLSC
ncbi:MAG: hypothetical protein ACKESC_00175 [Candidatus Hodgkinia cicadicola]